MSPGAYQPYQPVARPGGKPEARPTYRVLVHRKFKALWDELPERVGVENVQQFYDHVASTPGQPPWVGSSTILKGRAGRPISEGFSRTIHYEISGAGRIDYQYNATYRTTPEGDTHGVVFILTVSVASH